MSYSPDQFLANELLQENEFQRLVENAKQLFAADTQCSDEATSPDAEKTTGVHDTDFGDYELLEEIARGGMGVIYRARHKQLGRICALKMIRSGQLASKEEVSRFYGEAEAAASLDHPGIVPVYDVGKIGHHHYFSMGFVEGHSLAEDLREGPFEPERAATLTKQISEAIAYAHKRNVIHRDLKPANVLLDGNGHPQVTDFGLAKKTLGDNDLTATGQILGTPSFMPPEQAAGKVDEVNELADVYSLGAILYTLLTARPPFQAASQMDILFQVVNQEPLSPSKLTPKIPRDLETICLKCLHKDANRRYASATDLIADLDRWLNHQPIVARRTSLIEKAWLWSKRNPVIVSAACLLLLVVLVGLAALYDANAKQLCDSALKSDVENLAEISESLKFYSLRGDGKLLPIASNGDDAQEKIHAQIALVKRHPQFVKQLHSALLDDKWDFDYLQVIGDALLSTDNGFTDRLWTIMRNEKQSDSSRFRAGLVLSNYVGGNINDSSSDWQQDDANFLIQQYLETNPEFHPTIRKYLFINRAALRDSLSDVFFAKHLTKVEKIAVARAVKEFYPNDFEYTLPMLLIGSEEQYNELYPLIESADEIDPKLLLKVKEKPAENATVPERIRLARQRAGAAITLIRKGDENRDTILDVLRYENDPEALTQFVHRCKGRGVTPSDLWQLLERVDQSRGSLGDNRKKTDDSVMFGILLALGEFEFDDIPEPREDLVSRLGQIYAKDPSSGVHAATGWLLMKWQQLDRVRSVDQTPIAFDPSGHREWYIDEVKVVDNQNPQADVRESLYFTFVVFPAGEFQMGAPENEPYYHADEILHRVNVTRPIAVCDRELTWSHWIAMNGTDFRDENAHTFDKPIADDDPVFAITWYESIEYCGWLTERMGMTKNQQCYVEPDNLENPQNGSKTEWTIRLDRPGIRLPTDAEWEYFCRGGISTAFTFGNDFEWLDKYAWYKDNAGDWLHPVAKLRPSPRGLFDLHGNLNEWLHDRYSPAIVGGDDPIGPDTGDFRKSRGGGWPSAARYQRTAFGGWTNPDSVNSANGLRLVRSNLEFFDNEVMQNE